MRLGRSLALPTAGVSKGISVAESRILTPETSSVVSLNPESRTLNPASAAHLVGICGSGMRSLAEYLLDQGWRVTGSDSVPTGHNATVLRARGIAVHSQHTDS